MPKIFAISDLHLSFSANKPMDVFGSRWENYEDRLFENWQKKVGKDDVVLMPGDSSWSTYIRDADKDFDFINRLNGTKIISKGNHDYWWETLSKLNGYLEDKGFDTIRFIHNTNIVFGNVAVCGTKGYPEMENIPHSDTDKKLYNRELLRLSNAILGAKQTGAEKIVVMLHYPPGASTEFARLLQNECVDYCVFGHLHGRYDTATCGNVRGVEYKLVSCDYLKFDPLEICEFKKM